MNMKWKCFSSKMLIRYNVHGNVTLVDLNPGVAFNHVVDMYVLETQIANVKDFVHTDSELPAEANGKLKWKDSPIRPPGNVLGVSFHFNVPITSVGARSKCGRSLFVSTRKT
jgi:hypothetical protein